MKCPACEYERNWDDKDVEKKEEFISLHVTVTRELEYRTVSVGLVACPKCNCVIMSGF